MRRCEIARQKGNKACEQRNPFCLSGLRSWAFAAKTCDLMELVMFGYRSEMNVYVTCTSRNNVNRLLIAKMCPILIL
jgi:hypothetical protein